MTKMLKLNLFSFEWKYRILKQKTYFDTGFGILHYFRYIMMVWGLNEVQKMNAKLAIYGVLIYGVICYLVGYCWFRYEWVLANAEVGNRYNRLAKELRNYMKNKARKVRKV